MSEFENTLISMVQKFVREEVAKLAPQPEPQVAPKFINIDKVSTMSGYKKSTIYKLVSERKIPHYKNKTNGRKLMFMAEEIEQWLAGQRIGTTAEFVAERMGAQ